MPVPGSPSIMSFYLLHGEKGVFIICSYLAFPCHVFLLIAKKGGGFNICPYLAFPVSCLSTDRKLQNGGGF